MCSGLPVRKLIVASRPMTAVTSEPSTAALVRESFSSSVAVATMTSSSDMVEVRVAITSSTKNIRQKK